ncbi:hypothetical protein GCL60_01155 [Silvanigrella paludirubra]|uniref:Uncharacterized protein n=1 Tax=Silvanigrella paludirubra TaxID=2499159 RepID=A0A6N6VVB9_9BACT|nr:hypothetical protein [Silvanigrella paludirubra]KAB8040555.1 hypothetical protein GCL60_01155 [Silvanigrella paludirubra]
MNEFLSTEILQKMMKQKQSLIALNPKLHNFFTDIFFTSSGLKTKIPFLPIRCFRDFNLHTQAASDKDTIFYSSGSTNTIQAKHIFTEERLNLYSKNSCIGFERFLDLHDLKRDIPIISLIPPTDIWTKSSIAAMIGMFKNNGFNLEYCDVESNPQNIEKLLLNPKYCENIIIFGTTFHHLIVAEYVQKNKLTQIFKGQKLNIIDTGGTKGRTQSFNLQETIQIVKESYSNPSDFSFLSEYGMCELSSQAWSLKKIHDGSFQCNQTLTPIVVNLNENKVLGEGEYGFLAFFDFINMESWPSIITEDIACIIDQKEGIFHLRGRSPDATLKGCSLNVKDSFFFLDIKKENENTDVKTNQITSQKQFKSQEDIHKFIQTLNPSFWTSFCWSDLAESLICWNEIQVKNSTKLAEKNILIISSANIPIAWLYPTKVASLMGAKSVHIKLPSLRNEDPFANKIRSKIEDLVEKLKPYFFPTEIVIEKSRSLSKDYHNFDSVIVFGTDTTIQTFKKLLSGKNTHLIPQGDIKNSLIINLHYSTEEVAKLCSLWHGRGCLTPICLFMSGRDENNTLNWIQEFQLILENNFMERYKEEGIISKFIHDTQLLYTKAIIKNLGLEMEKTIFSGKLTHVFNLTKLTKDEILHSRLDFSFGGSGFVFVLDESVKPFFPQLSSEKIIPTLLDKHDGKTWEEWLDY